MITYDDVLTDPTYEALADSFRSAVAAVERAPGGPFEVDRRAAVWGLWGQLHEAAEGWSEWRKQAQGWRFRPPALLLAVWWRDHVGRRHLRLVGGSTEEGTALPPVPGPSRPPLACIYPGHCLITSENRRLGLLVVCDCGAWGAPEEVGWMGERCGPCADREEPLERPLRWQTGLGRLDALAVSPGGDQVACAGPSALQLHDLMTGKVTARWELESRAAQLSFSADGLRLVVGSDERRLLETRDLGTGQRKYLAGFPFAPVPPGSAVVVQQGPGRLCLSELGASDVVREFQVPPAAQVHAFAVSPDGLWLAGAAGAGGLLLWSVQTGRLHGRADVLGCNGPVWFSPDGRLVAAGVQTTHSMTLMLYDLRQGRLVSYLGGLPPPPGLAFSPEWDAVVTLKDDTLRTWDVQARRELRSLSFPEPHDRPVALAFAPGGRLLVLGMAGGEVRLWPGVPRAARPARGPGLRAGRAAARAGHGRRRGAAVAGGPGPRGEGFVVPPSGGAGHRTG